MKYLDSVFFFFVFIVCLYHFEPYTPLALHELFTLEEEKIVRVPRRAEEQQQQHSKLRLGFRGSVARNQEGWVARENKLKLIELEPR